MENKETIITLNVIKSRLSLLLMCLYIGVAFWATTSYAQPIVQPLPYSPALIKANSQKEVAKKSAQVRTRSARTQNNNRTFNALIPSNRFGYFDDFSSSDSPFPDTLRWMPKGGVTINNSFGVKPPSKNVATFDGMRWNGLPYSDTISRKGWCDTLESRPINLQAIFTPGLDEMIMRFRWQPGSFVPNTIPDTLSFFRLQFNKNIPGDSNWYNFWQVRGIDTTAIDSFQRALLIVPDTFITANFQFRFINFGQRNGWFDSWNLDYIQIQKNLDDLDTLSDITYTTPIKGFWNIYSAIPRKQYNASNGAFLANDIRAELRNNRPDPAFPIPFLPSIKFFDDSSGRLLGEVPANEIDGSFFIPPNNIDTLLVRAQRSAFPVAVLPPVADSIKSIRAEFTQLSSGSFNAVLTNDTISRSFSLGNEYAYDDGTAEAISFVNGPGAMGAVRFEAFTRDTLRAIKMYLPPIRPIPFLTTPLNFQLRVWRWLGNRTLQGPRGRDSILFRSVVIGEYTNAVNEFTVFDLGRPIIIEPGEFFVGWLQNANIENEVRVGFDVNYPDSTQFLFNRNGTWERFNRASGTTMIRAVMGSRPLPTNTLPARELEANIQIYPNPCRAGEVLSIIDEGNLNLKSVELISLSGQKFSLEPLDDLKFRLPSFLPKGLYILKITGANAQFSLKKLVVE